MSSEHRQKRSRDEEDEIEEIEDADEEVGGGDAPEMACRCKHCETGGELKELLQRMEQRDEANARIIQEMAKNVSDFKNVGMSMINKLTASIEEQQSGLSRLDTRTKQLGRVVKKLKTDGSDNEEGSNQAEAVLELTRKVALLSDTMVKGFSELKSRK
jgi:chromosome segregation ATPase